MRVEILLIILGMAIVTYIPRAIPAVLIDKLKFGKKLEKFLKLIPYTAMAALIFPSILGTDAQNSVIGIAGGTAAAIAAFFRLPAMVCVLAAIGVDFLLYLTVGV